MNLKKIAATLAGLLLFGAAASAEINLKDVGGGKVEITFLFKDSSSEMGVIGSFDNWTAPGEPMTKNADGVWEKTLSALATDEIVYKFYSKGTYIFDEQAPDKKDDGYGGFNGLIVVADILSGVTPMKPGAAPLAAPKVKAVGGRQKSTFGTETYFESASTFSTGDNELTKSVINAKSLWKFDGDLVPNLPGHLELTMFSGQSVVMQKDGQSWRRGGELVAGGLLMQPFYYLGGNKKPEVDKFRFGIDAPYLEWETGYANSTLPEHEGIVWQTVSDENKANAGFSSFRLGPKAREFGDFTIDAALVPNKSVGDYYGLYSFASVEAFGVKTEVQYEMKSGTKSEVSRWFELPSNQNWAVGSEGYFEDFLVRGQFLLSLYEAGGAADGYPLAEKIAYKAVGGYRDVYGDTELLAGYAYRGGHLNNKGKIQDAAKFLYLDDDANADELGASATQTLSLEGFQKYGYWGKAKAELSLVLPVGDNPDENQAFTAKPGFELDLDKLNIATVRFDGFALVTYNTAPGPGGYAVVWQSAGLKTSLPGLDLYYKADNRSGLFNTLLAEAPVGSDLKAQAGVGLRTGEREEQAVGMSLGVAYVVPVPEARTPTAYAQFVYNMDPYNSVDNLGSSSFDLTDFGPANGTEGLGREGALRVGLSWNY